MIHLRLKKFFFFQKLLSKNFFDPHFSFRPGRVTANQHTFKSSLTGLNRVNPKTQITISHFNHKTVVNITHGKQLIPGAFMSNNIFQIVSRIKKVKPQNKKIRP